MKTNQPAVTVSEASMQEWAMLGLAFHAARAPQKVQITRKPVSGAVREPAAVGGARTFFWLLLAGATVVLTSSLLLV